MIAESANDKNITFLFDWTEQCKYCEQSNQCLYKKKFYEYCTFIKNISNYFLESKGTDFELSIAKLIVIGLNSVKMSIINGGRRDNNSKEQLQ